MHDLHTSRRPSVLLTKNSGDGPRITPGRWNAQPRRFRRWTWLIVPLALLLAAPFIRAAGPEPIARWTFQGDARDSVGSMHGEVLGDAFIADGRLVLKGNGHVRTAPLGRSLAAKTLVARVKVAPLDQSGGGVLTVQSIGGVLFDAIVYGERLPGQWIAGSDEFRRTQDLAGAFPEEAGAGFVQMAVTYAADGTIAVYRNGLPYGQTYRPAEGLQEYGALDCEVLLGMRHGPRDRTGGNYFLRAEIDEAALYDSALTAGEVAELAGVTVPVETNLLVNGGFETGALAPWVVTGQPVFDTNSPTAIPVVVTDYAAQGGWSFRPYPNPGPGGSRISQMAPTEPGTEYVLSFAYALTWETPGSFSVVINGVEQEAVVLDPSLPLAHQSLARPTWAYATRTFTATAATSEIAFHFPPDLGGYALLDDVKIRPAADSSPVMTAEFASNLVTVDEGTTATIRVRRAGRLDQRGFATVELRPGTAQVGGQTADLWLGNGTSYRRLGLTFLQGQAEVAVAVRAWSDTLSEAPETATLHLLATGNATVSDSPATVTVITPPSRIAVSGWANEVGHGGQIFLQVERGGGGRVRVQTTDAGTAKPEEDFVPVDREVEVTSAGRVTIPIVILGDRQIEGTETIAVRVTPLASDVEVTPSDPRLPLDEEGLRVEIAVDSGEVAESDAMVRFTLIRAGQLDSTNVFRVRYRAEGWEDPEFGPKAALSGVDYLPAEGEVEFGPGVDRLTVEVALLNDSEPDGRRGLLLRTLGSPQLPHPVAAGFTAFVEIADDERAALVQEADLGPFLLGKETSLSRGPEGQTRVVQAGRIFELLPSGLPDLSFGGGKGQLSDPTGEVIDWLRNRMLEPYRLADGRYVLFLENRVVRWTPRGQPDPTFGNGSGSVSLPEPFDRLVHLGADGAVTLVTQGEGLTRLRRLLANGQPDPGFRVREFPSHGQFAVRRAASGHFWVLAPYSSATDPLVLWRLLPDGRMDPGFAPRLGLAYAFGLDAQDRAYFAVDDTWTSTVGDASPVALARFLADGNRDEDYLPARTDALWVQAEVSPDGSVLGATAGLEFFELNPEGDVVWRWIYPEPGAIGPAATREPDGRVRVSASVERTICFPCGMLCGSHCSSVWVTEQYRVSRDGSSEGLRTGPWFTDAVDFLDAAGVRWTESWFPYHAYERSLPVTSGSRVGFGRLTQIAAQGEPLQLPIQRAGSSAALASVRGRALPWRNGNWDASAAVPFMVQLPSETGDASLDLALPTAFDGTPLTEWLVRLESASGTDLSPLTECRLWVFSRTTPSAGALRIIPGSGPDTPHVAWLLGGQGTLQRSSDLRSWWDSLDGVYGAPLQESVVYGNDIGLDPGPSFFRIVQ